MLAPAALVLAVLAAASTTVIGLTSFTSFNPADWIRIASMAPLPFVFLASVGCAIAALRSSAGRTIAILAIVLDAAVLIGFVTMIAVGG